MAWEGILPAVLIGGALMAAGYGMQAEHKLFNEGRVSRVFIVVVVVVLFFFVLFGGALNWSTQCK